MAHKIIIDTDIGDDIDDAIAISFAVRRPELNVLAITTCYGPTRKRYRWNRNSPCYARVTTLHAGAWSSRLTCGGRTRIRNRAR